MVESSDAWVIGLVVVMVAFASAIVGWDPRILLNEPSSGVVVEPGGDSPGDTTVAMNLLLNVSSINWGVLEPGDSVERGLLLENQGNAAGVLSIRAGNFIPVAAEKFMNVSWSLAPGFVLDSGKNVAAALKLDLSVLVQNITDFSFDITILVTRGSY